MRFAPELADVAARLKVQPDPPGQSQLVHCDLTGNVLFAPGLADAMPGEGARVLSMGVDGALGAVGQDELRRRGLRATVITVTDDDAGDGVLRKALESDTYDVVGFGAGLSGQAPPECGATSTSTLWFSRLLNIVHAAAPTARIVLPRGPQDVLEAIERELAALPTRVVNGEG